MLWCPYLFGELGYPLPPSLPSRKADSVGEEAWGKRVAEFTEYLLVPIGHQMRKRLFVNRMQRLTPWRTSAEDRIE